MSKIFQPFRAVGVVSGDVPFCLNALGTRSFVTVPVGNAFHVYDCADLRLSLVSALTDLLTSEATPAGLRVRDEYVRSAQVLLLVGLYVLADVTLRALALLVFGYALGEHLGLAVGGTLGSLFMFQTLRVFLCAFCSVFFRLFLFLVLFVGCG